MVETFEDYYAVLGVTKTAEADEIKRAYRRLAVQYHPDRNPGDTEAEERFKLCVQAYAILSHPDKRKRYDQTGHAAFGAQGDASGIDLKEVLESIRDMFRSGRRRSHLPADLSYHLEITFEEAALGTEKPIQVDRSVPCTECDGTGAAIGTLATTCIPCKGQGHVHKGKGVFKGVRDCEVCHGTGQIIENPCMRCSGKRVMQRTEALLVQVPAGIEHGNTRTLRGAGDRTLSHAGDLHLYIHIKEHPIFTRKASDIHCSVSITYPQAVLGAEIDVPTVSGPVVLKIPPGTASGKIFRLRGKGFPVLGAYGKGDQYVHVEVDIPSKITNQQRQLLIELGHTLMPPTTRLKS